MNNKPKISKYQVTVGTEIKGFRRHAQMKKFVRTLNPATTIFKTEYWSGRTGITGGYLPSWEWSTEGQLQYQANRAAHLARKAEAKAPLTAEQIVEKRIEKQIAKEIVAQKVAIESDTIRQARMVNKAFKKAKV